MKRISLSILLVLLFLVLFTSCASIDFKPEIKNENNNDNNNQIIADLQREIADLKDQLNDSGSDSEEKAPAVKKVTSISLDKTSLPLTEGETYILTATVKPVDATNRDVTWESDSVSIATVDQDGEVTAISAGKAKITVIADDGSGKSKTITVTVKKAKSSPSESVIESPTEPIPATSLNVRLGSALRMYSSSGGDMFGGYGLSDRNSDNPFSMGGTRYYSGVTGDRGGTAYYNLNREYTTLSGYYGFDDRMGSAENRLITLFGDDEVLVELIAVANGLPEPFSVDVTDVRVLSIRFACPWDETLAIGDAVLD